MFCRLPASSLVWLFYLWIVSIGFSVNALKDCIIDRVIMKLHTLKEKIFVPPTYHTLEFTAFSPGTLSQV